MKVSLVNIGCKVNYSEMSQIGEEFRKLGAEIVEFGTPSDITLINTCTVTSKADADCRKLIRRAIRISPDSFIGVMGCYAQLNARELQLIEGVDAIFGLNDKFLIPQIIRKFEKREKAGIFTARHRSNTFYEYCSIDNDSHSRIFMKIQDGCDYFCSYCTVAFARGRSRSMDFGRFKEILKEIEGSGFYEVVLSGINLGEYRSPGGETLLDILRYIEDADSGIRFRISSLEPNLFTKEVLSLAAHSKSICPHFHIPLQSGSQEILTAMGRRYLVDDFRRLVLDIKSCIPDCCIGVDVISGFPGETEGQFEETYKLLELLPVSYLHPFSYSGRKNTKSEKLPGKVPQNIIKERTKEFIGLSNDKRRLFYESQLGKLKTAIPEESREQNGFHKGWTENYVRIKFRCNGMSSNMPVPVNLVKLEDSIVFAEIVPLI